MMEMEKEKAMRNMWHGSYGFCVLFSSVVEEIQIKKSIFLRFDYGKREKKQLINRIQAIREMCLRCKAEKMNALSSVVYTTLVLCVKCNKTIRWDYFV